jgi:hypothetical protein
VYALRYCCGRRDRRDLVNASADNPRLITFEDSSTYVRGDPYDRENGDY